MNKKYCNSLFEYSRVETTTVNVGNIAIGGKNPIRIQSMTTTNTTDTQLSIDQATRLANVGCEIIRFTAPNKLHAANLQNIKDGLVNQGINAPLVADIHFTPNAAEVAADIVEKIRVNPGNYADKKKFEEIDYTDTSYQQELDRIREKFTPLVLKCKANNVAMRIGTNHGSLSDRILSRYGDTPLGMVESALEFIQICEDNEYYSLVVSMKSSNTQVMVQAYRLLMSIMMTRERIYPLHLGVTEAGDGEDGRIKSAVGIATLLEDGIGDTIRVSLTEEPEAEIPVAFQLVNRYKNRAGNVVPTTENPINPFEYSRRVTEEVSNIGDHQVPVVVADFSDKTELRRASLFSVGYRYAPGLDKWNIGDLACDYIFLGKNAIDFELPGLLRVIQNYSSWDGEHHYPFYEFDEYFSASKKHPELNFISVGITDLTSDNLQKLKKENNFVLVLSTENDHAMAELRAVFFLFINNGISVPVILRRNYSNQTPEGFQLNAASDVGGLFLDGLGDGLWITASDLSPKVVNDTTFGILQATRTRISKTEYISCPSCGRTLFDLQETTAKIRAKTSHLKGLKIGIMGCIVNGPGEMADADYGYVGTGVGKINLYKEKTVVQRNVNEVDAVDELIELIKSHGDWIDVEGE